MKMKMQKPNSLKEKKPKQNTTKKKQTNQKKPTKKNPQPQNKKTHHCPPPTLAFPDSVFIKILLLELPAQWAVFTPLKYFIFPSYLKNCKPSKIENSI